MAANYRHRKVTTPIKPEVARLADGARSSGAIPGPKLAAWKNSTKSTAPFLSPARRAPGGVTSRAPRRRPRKSEKIRSKNVRQSLRRTKATMNGSIGWRVGSLAQLEIRSNARKRSKKRAAEVTFSGSSSKIVSEQKGPRPIPCRYLNYGKPRRLWIPDQYGDRRRVSGATAASASHSVISRCDKARLVLRELKPHQE